MTPIDTILSSSYQSPKCQHCSVHHHHRRHHHRRHHRHHQYRHHQYRHHHRCLPLLNCILFSCTTPSFASYLLFFIFIFSSFYFRFLLFIASVLFASFFVIFFSASVFTIFSYAFSLFSVVIVESSISCSNLKDENIRREVSCKERKNEPERKIDRD